MLIKPKGEFTWEPVRCLCVAFNVACTSKSLICISTISKNWIQYKRHKNSWRVCSSYLLLGFRGVTLDRFSCHHGFQRLLDSADLLGLDVQLQGEEWLQSGWFFRVLLIHHRSEEENSGWDTRRWGVRGHPGPAAFREEDDDHNYSRVKCNLHIFAYQREEGLIFWLLLMVDCFRDINWGKTIFKSGDLIPKPITQNRGWEHLQDVTGLSGGTKITIQSTV